jgi:uncharacterized membrane protein (DUF485 family)
MKVVCIVVVLLIIGYLFVININIIFLGFYLSPLYVIYLIQFTYSIPYLARKIMSLSVTRLWLVTISAFIFIMVLIYSYYY